MGRAYRIALSFGLLCLFFGRDASATTITYDFSGVFDPSGAFGQASSPRVQFPNPANASFTGTIVFDDNQTNIYAPNAFGYTGGVVVSFNFGGGTFTSSTSAGLQSINGVASPTYNINTHWFAQTQGGESTPAGGTGGEYSDSNGSVYLIYTAFEVGMYADKTNTSIYAPDYSTLHTSIDPATGNFVTLWAYDNFGNAMQYSGVLTSFSEAPSSTSAVPLPAALPLFGGALSLAGLLTWRRSRQTNRPNFTYPRIAYAGQDAECP